MDLLSKAAALYFSPESIGSDEGTHCGICWKFIQTGACVEVNGTIKPEKTCGLYVHGKPFKEDPGFTITKVSKEEAGYGNGPTHCANCEHMLRPKLFGESRCTAVEGIVEGRGCCTAKWEPR